MVSVGEKCRSCKYFSDWTFTCDYCVIRKKSRTLTDGKKIDPKLCDKYEEGRRETDPNEFVRSEFAARKAERRRKNG